MGKIVSIFLLLGVSAISLATDVTGKIKVVSPNTNSGWDGVLIQMADAVIVDSSCGNNTWALIRINDDLGKALFSTALAVQTSQQTVRIFTSECASPPETLGTVPIVSAMDIGTRD